MEHKVSVAVFTSIDELGGKDDTTDERWEGERERVRLNETGRAVGETQGGVNLK